MVITREQKDKLRRLEDLRVIAPGENPIDDARLALTIAYKMNLIDHWTDHGNFYTIGLKTEGKVIEKRLRSNGVGEFIVDRMLSAKDPLDETANQKTSKEKTKTEEPQQEGKENPKEPISYNDMTSAELTELLKERDIPSSGSKADKVKRLEESDAEIL